MVLTSITSISTKSLSLNVDGLPRAGAASILLLAMESSLELAGLPIPELVIGIGQSHVLELVIGIGRSHVRLSTSRGRIVVPSALVARVASLGSSIGMDVWDGLTRRARPLLTVRSWT